MPSSLGAISGRRFSAADEGPAPMARASVAAARAVGSLFISAPWYYYKIDGFHRVLKKFVGKTIISAQDVEDIVAYLITLK